MIRQNELPPFLNCIIEELNGPIRSDVRSSYSTKIIDAIILVLRRLKAQSEIDATADNQHWSALMTGIAGILSASSASDSREHPEAKAQHLLADARGMDALVSALRSGDVEVRRWLDAVARSTLDRFDGLEQAIRPNPDVRKGAESVADGLDALRSGLGVYLRARYPTLPVDPIDDMTVAPGGQIKRTVIFGLKANDALPRRLVFRQDMPFNFTGTIVTDEYQVMRRLFGLGLMVPEPVLCEADETLLDGKFMIMREIENAEPAGTYFPEERTYLGSNMSQQFGTDVAVALAQLHGRTCLPASQSNGTADREAALARVRKDWSALAKPANSIIGDVGLAWLLANPLPEDRPSCLIHGDMGAHNMMARDRKLAAILDWELARIGDPSEDLAQARALLLPDVMPWEDFKHAYIAAGGAAAACDDHAMAYYGIWSFFKHLVMAVRLWNYFMNGERDDAPAACVAGHFVDRLILYEARAVADAIDVMNARPIARQALA